MCIRFDFNQIPKNSLNAIYRSMNVFVLNYMLELEKCFFRCFAFSNTQMQTQSNLVIIMCSIKTFTDSQKPISVMQNMHRSCFWEIQNHNQK